MKNGLSEALADALGRVVADARREWDRDKQIILASTGQVVAELRLEVGQLKQELRDAVAERLANVRDGKDAEPGAKGDPGTDGRDGQDGKDGTPGEAGAKGDPGTDGKDGEPGERGEPGADGKDGEPGERGAKGDPGEHGKDGKDGRDGEPGAKGDAGKDGKLPVCKAYTPGKVHYESDVVSDNGSLWQARQDTAHAPPHDDWICLAERGKDGASPSVHETFDPIKTYQRLAIVALNGGSFIARKDDPGPCPGDGWQLLASAGKRGQNGERGERGIRGAEGIPGPSIIAWRVDVKQYAVTPVMSDGSDGPALPIRELFEQFQIETNR